MASLSRQAERLRGRADALVPAVPRMTEGPEAELERAKRRLRRRGERVDAGLALLGAPMRGHPWLTLTVAAGAGAALGGVDDASGGRLHRAAMRGLVAFLRTGVGWSRLNRL